MKRKLTGKLLALLLAVLMLVSLLPGAALAAESGTKEPSPNDTTAAPTLDRRK